MQAPNVLYTVGVFSHKSNAVEEGRTCLFGDKVSLCSGKLVSNSRFPCLRRPWSGRVDRQTRLSLVRNEVLSHGTTWIKNLKVR